MAALFIIVQTWKQPGCPSVGEWIMEHCSVLSHSVSLLDCGLPGSSVYGIFQVRILQWSGLPFPTPGDLPDPRIKPLFPASPALAGGFFTTVLLGKQWNMIWH